MRAVQRIRTSSASDTDSCSRVIAGRKSRPHVSRRADARSRISASEMASDRPAAAIPMTLPTSAEATAQARRSKAAARRAILA